MSSPVQRPRGAAAEKEEEMHGRKHIHRVAALLTAVAALAFFAGSVQAANSRPQYYAGASSSLPPQAARALGERYEAMAQYYAGASSSLPPQAARALGERYEAMAEHYQQAQLEQARRQAAAFSWADAGIGALVAIGAVALLGLGALGIRSHSERSASPAAS
jgi:hypothetical protein